METTPKVKHTPIYRKLLSDIFLASLSLYVIFFLLEEFFSGFVIDYFNLNVLLGFVFVSGIALALTVTYTNESAGDLTQVNSIPTRIFISAGFGVLSGGIVWLRTVRALGQLTIPISVFVTFVVAVMIFLLLSDNQDRHSEKDQ